MDEIIKVKPVDSQGKSQFIKIGHTNALLQQLPNVFSAKLLSGAYKVVVPEGTTGKLMQYKNGLLGTPMVDKNRIFTKHAGLKSMSNAVSPLLVFSALSIVTGQFFLTKIDKGINDVLEEIKNLRQLFLLKEESNLFSQSMFLKRISNDFSYINTTSELKIATLTNIQTSINQLTSSIYFFTNNVIQVLDSIKQSGYENTTFNVLNQHLEKLKLSADLRNMFILYEFAFSQSFDKFSIAGMENKIHSNNEEVNNLFIKKILKTSEVLQKQLIKDANTRKKQNSLKLFMDDLRSLDTGINTKYIKETDNFITEAFSHLKKIEDSGTEFYVYDDGVYITK